MAVYDSIDFDLFKSRFDSLKNSLYKLNINFAGIGIFPTDPGVIYLSVTITNAILTLHKKYHQIFDDYIGHEWSYYLPDKWTPHCTIAIDIPKQFIHEVVKRVVLDFQPIEAKIEELGVVEFRPVKQLFSMII